MVVGWSFNVFGVGSKRWPAAYFSYIEVLTQPGFHDSAGDDDPDTVERVRRMLRRG
jgi:hypothetical protein